VHNIQLARERQYFKGPVDKIWLYIVKVEENGLEEIWLGYVGALGSIIHIPQFQYCHLQDFFGTSTVRLLCWQPVPPKFQSNKVLSTLVTVF
jgi:hypothetical protein